MIIGGSLVSDLSMMLVMFGNLRLTGALLSKLDFDLS